MIGSVAALGCGFALVGLSAMFSLMQLRRGQTGWLALIAFAFFLWRVGTTLHWWTVAAFFATAILAGSLNAVLLRARGQGFAPILASVVRALAILACVVVLVLLAAAR